MPSTHGMSSLSMAKHVHGIMEQVHWKNTLCIFIVSGSSNLYSITPTLFNIFKGPIHLGSKLFAHGTFKLIFEVLKRTLVPSL